MAHFFLIGPGFIGGTLLTEILRPENKKLLGIETISVLTRRNDQGAETLQKLGVRPVRGTLESLDVIADEARKADIIVHAATADDLPSVQAVLDGISKRATEGKQTVYLHTSGAGVLDDFANGLKPTDKVYSDEDPASIDALPDDNPHRPIDLAIKRAAGELLARNQRLAIIMPPNIYGVGTGPFNAKSIQVPVLIGSALKAGSVLAFGEGKNVWSTIHVRDLIDGYLAILKYLVDLQSPLPSPWNPYFFASSPASCDFVWSDLYTAIATTLARRGLLKGPHVRFNAQEEFRTTLGLPEETKTNIRAGFGANSLSRADRLAELGWKAKAAKGNKERPDLFESIETDVDTVLAEYMPSQQ